MKTTCQVVIAVYALVQTLVMIGKDMRAKDDSDLIGGLFSTAAIMSVYWSVLYFAGSFSELIGD